MDRETLIFQYDLEATNNLRVAIYNYELKTINNLQLINGGAASLLITFLTQAKIHYTLGLKFFFTISTSLFLIGLAFSLALLFISPNFMEARYRINEINYGNKMYEKCKRKRLCCFLGAVTSFFIGIVIK